MITIVCGQPRNGKGIYALELIAQAVASGRPVYTNIELLPACPFYSRVCMIDDREGKWPVYRGRPATDDRAASDDYLAFWHYCLPGSVVVIDEADLYFDCTEHAAMAADIRRFLKQHGKLGFDLIFIVQSIGNLYVRIRRLAQRIVVCEWEWRTRRWPHWLSAWIGAERARRLTGFVRAEFSDASLNEKVLVEQVRVPYSVIADQYFVKPWYRTEQLLGDVSHLRWAFQRQMLEAAS